MLKHIDPEKLSPNSHSENRIVPGAKIEDTIEELKRIRDNPNNDTVTDVIIHAGTNNLPKDDCVYVADKLREALRPVF